jgi:hypothetical protein
MIEIEHLLAAADAYKKATGVASDTTVSHRVFGDSKKLRALRAGGDITVTRFNGAMAWFRDNWPEGTDMPAEITERTVEQSEPAPAQAGVEQSEPVSAKAGNVAGAA